jgi:hypothetical protein
MFVKGNTAMDGLSGRLSVGVSVAVGERTAEPYV